MSKQLLTDIFESIGVQQYTWALYFFKIDRRNMNPYTVHKIRFKNNDYLPQYVKELASMVLKYQLSKISEVKEYTGENTKISCDKLSTRDDLIKEQWEYLAEDVANSSDGELKGGYQGYILEGTLTEENKNLIFAKIAKPVINLQNKRSAVFVFDDNKQLAALTDEVCKLYMNIDFLVTDETLYSFNYKFEEMFNFEKTMQKAKEKAIAQIIGVNAFSEQERFENYAKSYKSPRTFLTLNAERMDRIKQKNKRGAVAKLLNIQLDADGKFLIKDEREASLLIRYLCYKVFKDGETQDLLEASSVSKVTL